MQNKENESFLFSRACSTQPSLCIQRHPDNFHVLRKTLARGMKKSVSQDWTRPEPAIVSEGLERFRCHKTIHKYQARWSINYGSFKYRNVKGRRCWSWRRRSWGPYCWVTVTLSWRLILFPSHYRMEVIVCVVHLLKLVRQLKTSNVCQKIS